MSNNEVTLLVVTKIIDTCSGVFRGHSAFCVAHPNFLRQIYKHSMWSSGARLSVAGT